MGRPARQEEVHETATIHLARREVLIKAGDVAGQLVSELDEVIYRMDIVRELPIWVVSRKLRG